MKSNFNINKMLCIFESEWHSLSFLAFLTDVAWQTSTNCDEVVRWGCTPSIQPPTTLLMQFGIIFTIFVINLNLDSPSVKIKPTTTTAAAAIRWARKQNSAKNNSDNIGFRSRTPTPTPTPIPTTCNDWRKMIRNFSRFFLETFHGCRFLSSQSGSSVVRAWQIRLDGWSPGESFVGLDSRLRIYFLCEFSLLIYHPLALSLTLTLFRRSTLSYVFIGKCSAEWHLIVSFPVGQKYGWEEMKCRKWGRHVKQNT